MAARFPRKLYLLFSAVFTAAAVYHLIGALGLAFFLAPQWRHTMWVAIDGGMAYAMLHPRPWLIAPLAAITSWSLYSHGWLVFLIWRGTGQMDWLSLAVVIAMPLMLARVIRDSRNPGAFAVR